MCLYQVSPFFDFLTSTEKLEYERLRCTLSAPERRYNRNRRVSTFEEILNEVKAFCRMGNGLLSIRSVVCGICWIGDDIALNICDFRNLIGRSKSSINGVFQKMGYESVTVKGKELSLLLTNLPILKSKMSECRKWTIRRVVGSSEHQLLEFPKSVSAPMLTITPVIKDEEDSDIFTFDPISDFEETFSF